jgi:hypothetical protein
MLQGDAMGTIRKDLQRAVTAALLLAIGVVSARAGTREDRIAELQAKFRCPIFDYLQAFHKYPTPQRMDNRFLIVTIAHREDQRYYAQCAFDSMDTRMLCELDSPASNPTMKKYFRGEKLKLVKALGYRVDKKNNYHQWPDARTPEALYDIAGLLVDTLGRVFEMQTDETLTYKAPLVAGTPKPTEDSRKYCGQQISLR